MFRTFCASFRWNTCILNEVRCIHRNGLLISLVASKCSNVSSTSQQVIQKRMARSDQGNLGRIVYSAGNMAKLIRFVKLLSLSTTSIAFLMQPVIWQDMLSGPDRTALLTTLTLSSLSVFVMCSPLLLNILTKRYAVSMYYDEKTDTFTVATLNLFAQTVITKFHFEQVRRFDAPFQLANVAIGRHALLLISSNFVDERALAKFKPLLGEEEDEDKVVKQDDDEDGLV